MANSSQTREKFSRRRWEKGRNTFLITTLGMNGLGEREEKSYGGSGKKEEIKNVRREREGNSKKNDKRSGNHKRGSA